MKLEKELEVDVKTVIESTIREVRNLKSVVISTEDGFEIAGYSENSEQIPRLSAMASSLSALSALAAKESSLGSCRNMIIEAEFGVIIVLQIRRGQHNLNMSIIAGKDAIVGQILYFAKQAVCALRSA